ncbi:phosphatase PAP2 family protein [Vibrio sp. B1FLJ16]|uniref:phosphatase PAP2 family protein n=1 Tax=Vibrio sp. B1FLJ16 TaxID=2751178 RepID=UPI0015F3C7E1|nr:phosphatase PAP2 family protein [Vibrio sp. B1FLJ16]
MRTAFFVSFLLCWAILGNVLAMLLSSAGPVFLSRLSPSNDTYDLLMQILETKHAWLIERDWPGLYSLATQDMLWDAYVQNKDILGSGISAMPSLHVSMAVLLALSITRVNRKLGSLFWVFALVIFIGSFTLGWHYFVDGLVSAPLTIVIWRISNYVANHSTSSLQEHEKLLRLD